MSICHATAASRLTSRGTAFAGPVINDDGMPLVRLFTDPDSNSLDLAEMSQSYK